MDLGDIVNKLLADEANQTELIATASRDLIAQIQDSELKIIDIVKGIDPILTNGSHSFRLKGVELLVQIITSLPKNLLNEKEIEVLSEFLCLRLIDHKSMEPATLSCLSYFIDCNHKPARYNKQLLDFIKTKLSVQKMDSKTRNLVYKIVRKVILERHQAGTSIDSDTIYSLVHIIEGENNPENLMLCFGLVSYILKNFSDLEPYIDDLFEWLASYYPIDYTPKTVETVNIQRLDLVQVLYDCFYASPLCADNLQTLLLEKLDSNMVSTKLESLDCLVKCYEVFPLSSVKNYNSTLWTSIRINCLRKSHMIDSTLFDHCLRTLSALARKLCEDADLYFTFVSNMYEELALAFRKPEMDLFEPAAKLLTHAVIPKIVGFNYILSKMLPVSLNALEAKEYRPLSGLAYLFEQLHIHHPSSNLSSDLNELVTRLVSIIIDCVDSNEDALRILFALVRHKFHFKEETFDRVTTDLTSKIDASSLDLEGCIALVCINYQRIDLVCSASTIDYSSSSLMQLIGNFKAGNLFKFGQNALEQQQFSVYLRMVTMKLDDSSRNDIDSIDIQVLRDFLKTLREFASRLFSTERLIEKISQIHSIVLNKLNAERVTSIMMDYFGSSFCQKLVPIEVDETIYTEKVYLPLLGWVFKSLVIRNHQLYSPLINLLLNFITSERVELDQALLGCQLFNFLLKDESPEFFDTSRHYNKFFLHKQKFFTQTSKEIKLRYDLQSDDLKKNLLLCSIAIQVPNLPLAVYKKDRDWLIRQLLKVLSAFKFRTLDGDLQNTHQDEILLSAMYGCAESLMQKDLCADLSGFLSSLVDINLKHAQVARTMQVRQKALSCLASIATSFTHSDLIPLRPKVVDELRHCLSDRKRLVRQAAAEARLRWMLIGQPVGPPGGTE